jgi:hypothetical protein
LLQKEASCSLMDKIYIAALTPNKMTAELSSVILRRRMQIWLEIRERFVTGLDR